MNRNVFLILTLGLVWQGASAQPGGDKTPVVLVENAPDNRAGFEAFARMGLLPLPPGTRPVGGQIRDPALVRKQVWFNHFNIVAWQAPVSNGVVRLLVDNHWVSYPAKRISGQHARLQRWMEVEDEEGDGEEGEKKIHEPPLAYLQDIELGDAVRGLFASLRKEAEENEKRRSRRPPDPDQTGALMVFASRLHQVGETNAANQLAAHLFNTAGKREALMAGVNFLADDAYHQALETFFHGGTAEDLIRDTEAVRARFRQGWRRNAPLGEWVARWKKSLELTDGELPAVDGVEPDERQIAFYRQFLEKPELAMGAAGMRGRNWLLEPKAVDPRYGNNTPADFISPKDLRLEAIPPLRLMLADTRLLPINGANLGMGNHYRMHRRSGDDLGNTPQPMKLSDYAAMMLAGAIPGLDGLDPSEDANLEAMGDAALDFYKANKGKDRFAWAKAVLEASEGGWNIPRDAVLTLLASPHAADRTVAEAHILQSEGGMNLSGDLLAYANHIGDGAKPFVKEFIAGVEIKQADQLNRPDSHVGRMLQPFKEWLDPQATDGPAPELEPLLDAFVSEKMDFQELIVQAGPILKARSAKEQQEAVASVLQRASPDAIPQLIQFLRGLSMDMGWNRTGMHSNFALYLDPDAKAGEGNDARGPELPVEAIAGFTPIPELWLPLLAEPGDASSRTRALVLASQFIFPHMRHEDNAYFLHAGDPNKTEEAGVYLEFARKALALPPGGKLEGLPRIQDIPAERRKDILATLQGGKPEDILAILESPAWSERMFAMVLSADESVRAHTNAWSGFETRRWKMTRVDDGTFAQNYEPPPEFVLGRDIQVGDLEALLRQAQAFAKAGESGRLSLVALPAYRGLSLSRHRASGRQGRRTDGPLFVEYSGHRQHNQASVGLDQEIRLAKPEGDVPGAGSGDGFESMFGGDPDLQWKQFVAGLHEWRKSPQPPGNISSFSIQFQSSTPQEEQP